jgi:hypothetical protein
MPTGPEERLCIAAKALVDFIWLHEGAVLTERLKIEYSTRLHSVSMALAEIAVAKCKSK